MKLSAFGEKFSGPSGIVEVMDDLGAALRDNPDMIFMGGGNPGRVPQVEAIFQQRLEAIMNDPEQRHSLFGIYQAPQGDPDFRQQVASCLNKQYGWNLKAGNIAVSNGSQPAFFALYNMFAGRMSDGSHRQIHLPLAPEYLGYADVGLSNDFFTATRPTIELMDKNLFKYHVDFSTLNLTETTGAMCVSRPTNPTGNILTDDEIAHLDEIAQRQGIPFIIDSAYGSPFPNIMFAEATPHWNENTIITLSLSKLGLPGVRTGIIVAREDIIDAYCNINAIVSLACGTLGPALAKELFRTGEILSLSRDYITPFYQQRSQQTVQWFRREMGDLPYRIHKPEGAIFLWLWLEGMPISSQQLYTRLKEKGVLVVPGQNFFIGMDDNWAHKHECIRVSYAQDARSVEKGVGIIAGEVRLAYEGK